jgi:pyruvate dehydrogenase E2 component (dihydrolipoamide acetyltransferase)/2-oxoisovalerate dehydrogenase E2 component (dihydrolipoyl transacylase)
MDFSLPPVGEGLYEVELVKWLVQPGDEVARGQGLAEVMSDKATMEVPAPFAGTIAKLAAEPGAKVQVGEVILSYTPAGKTAAVPAGVEAEGDTIAEPARPAAAPAAREEQPVPVHANGPVAPSGKAPAAAPSVRLLARKLGVDLARVRGSGPHGRILLDDLTPYLNRPPADGERPAKPEALKIDLGVAGTRVKLVGLRRKIAEHLVQSTRTIPHYSYIDECDLSDIVRLRNQLREPFAKAGVKLTYLSFFVKAAARALKEVPIVNSSLDEDAGEIVLHSHCHIGVAVATPGGLIVPVIKDADRKDLAAIASEIERLSSEAKAGRARLDDLRGGTFTVTSVGNIGGLISTPIINHPEVGIMGVGKAIKRPVYDEHGILHPADVIYLSFSFDHRIVDGAVGAAFGNAVIAHLRNPGRLLLAETFGG